MLQIVTELPKLPPRAPDSHKGTFGTVLVIAGNRGMSGAAVLCGSAALRGGAGLVRVATPIDIQPLVASSNPCYLTAALPIEVARHGLSEDAAPAILELAESATVVAIGPGLGRQGKIGEIIEMVLTQLKRPIVVDADALNALASLHGDVLKRREAPTILTPHPAEFGRLLKISTAEVQARRQELASSYAAQSNVVLVLKGHQTIVTDGQRLYVNSTGNPGMATGGTGDVLTGLIAALVAQGLAPFEAAQLGVNLHGRSGDLAAEQKGQVSLIATDLLDFLPQAFEQAR